MTVLLIAEHDGGLKATAQQVLVAALQCSDTVDLLLCGASPEAVVQAQCLQGVRTVLTAEAEPGVVCAASLVVLLEPILSDYTHIMMASSTFSKDVIPRLAAHLQVAPLTDVIAILDANAKHYQRYLYAGNVLADVCSHDGVQVMTIRATAFQSDSDTQESCPTQGIGVVMPVEDYTFLEASHPDQDMPDLATANFVVSGGRGLKDKAGFEQLTAIAMRMGAALGASRAAVDAQLVPNDRQVGQTGQIVAPAVYIAVGISGAIQHLAGMKDSRVVVVINKDSDAPILDVADYALIGDIADIMPAWDEALTELGL